jgi:hypothetical protein
MQSQVQYCTYECLLLPEILNPSESESVVNVSVAHGETYYSMHPAQQNQTVDKKCTIANTYTAYSHRLLKTKKPPVVNTFFCISVILATSYSDQS